MKRKKINGIILLIVTVLILFFILKDNFLSIFHEIKNLNIGFFFLAIFLFVLVLLFEAMISKNLIKEYKKDYSLKEAFNLMVVTKFFNGITPFSTGGRPLQVLELKKRGLRILHGTSVIVQNFIVSQCSFIIFSSISLLINYAFKIFPVKGFLYSMTIIGFIINIVLLLIAFLFSKSKKINIKIVNFIVMIIFKMKIIKDKEKYYKRFEKICSDYYIAFNDFKHKKTLILKSIGMQLLTLTINFSIVAVLFVAFNLKLQSVLSIIIAGNLVYLTGCYIPIPGGSGGMEYAFLNYFNLFVAGSKLSSLLIVWRFVTYYLPTLIGGIVFNIKRNRS